MQYTTPYFQKNKKINYITLLLTLFLHQSARNGIVSGNIGIFCLSRTHNVRVYVHGINTMHGELSRRQKFRYSLRQVAKTMYIYI